MCKFTLMLSVYLYNMDNITRYSVEDFPYVGHLTIGVILCVTCFLGTSLNGIAMFIYSTSNQIQTPTNTFIFALNISDFILSVMATPMAFISSFSGRWVFGEGGCSYYGFFVCLSGYSSVTILAVISLDRYIVVVKPHLKQYITNRTAVLMCICSILYGLLWAVLPLLGWNHYTLEAVKTSCSILWESNDQLASSYNLTIAVTCFFLQLGVITFCYLGIILKIRKSRFVSTQNYGIEKEVTKTVLTVIVFFLVSWSPYAGLSFYTIFRGTPDLPPALLVTPAIFAKISVIWNPIVYLGRNQDFKKELVTRIPLFRRLCPVSNTTSQVSREIELPPGSQRRNISFTSPHDLPKTDSTYVNLMRSKSKIYISVQGGKPEGEQNVGEIRTETENSTESTKIRYVEKFCTNRRTVIIAESVTETEL